MPNIKIRKNQEFMGDYREEFDLKLGALIEATEM